MIFTRGLIELVSWETVASPTIRAGDNVIMAITQQATATAGQKKQLARFTADTLEKVGVEVLIEELGLDSPGAQRVIEHGDEYAACIREAAIAAFKDLSVTDKYKDEERPSTYGYLSGYKPKGLTEQCNKLRELFPGVGYPNQDLLAQIEKGEVPLPKGAEGWFAIPNRIKHPQIFGLSYGGALQKVFNVLKQTLGGKFHNYREGQLGPEYLRLTARTEKFLADLSVAQGNPEILIVPAQFGLRHRGRSVRRAREVYAVNEFGHDPFIVGIMLLTHPERLQNVDDLWIDCGGAEFSQVADGDFSLAPLFIFLDGGVLFGGDWVSGAGGHCGSVSGFAPR